MTFWINLIGLLSTGLAAVFWLVAASIRLPDNINTFIRELQRAGQWNAAGGISACVGFACQAILFWTNLS
ncbi:hypothetical protein X737_36415 [Mesorhizobium sp. L48C026A00]|uniref:hypothetical protein n=1 Tax=Mesorhizobium sp. TaxID=1871066 RepID=UPI0003D02A2F|nr:hypothetical protein [Mesorhizobium sp.]ESZ04965.1 hypothetical protein X737_36415 [Mesorhizobium sp. L48C026A00]